MQNRKKTNAVRSSGGLCAWMVLTDCMVDQLAVTLSVAVSVAVTVSVTVSVLVYWCISVLVDWRYWCTGIMVTEFYLY